MYMFLTLLTEGRLPEAFGWRSGGGSRGQARNLHSGDPEAPPGGHYDPPARSWLIRRRKCR
jgi:hypothetical protein